MKKQFCFAFCLVVGSSMSFAQTPVLKDEAPVVLKAHKLEPFELPAGTFFPLVLENADELIPVARVSADVLDFYGNVTIPHGSRMAGKYVGFKSGRHLVEWTSLQIPSRAGSLRIEPSLLGTMRDGSTGYIQYAPGTAVGALSGQEFIVPQR